MCDNLQTTEDIQDGLEMLSVSALEKKVTALRIKKYTTM